MAGDHPSTRDMGFLLALMHIAVLIWELDRLLLFTSVIVITDLALA